MEQYSYEDEYNTRMANYRYVEEANRKGVDLSKLEDKLKRYEMEIEDHHKEIAELKKRAQTSSISAELFGIQEATVKDMPTVQHAKKICDTAKIHALHRVLAMYDPQYKSAYETYEKAVTDAYVTQAKPCVPATPQTQQVQSGTSPYTT